MTDTRMEPRDAWLKSGHPETTCQRCGGPNVWSWSAPSPLWSAVMRDPETGDDEFTIVCPVCFAELASLRGIGGAVLDGLPRWTWRFEPELTALATPEPTLDHRPTGHCARSTPERAPGASWS